MKVRFFDIRWDIDEGDEPDLPSECVLEVDDDIDLDEEGADALSDKYGWCVLALVRGRWLGCIGTGQKGEKSCRNKHAHDIRITMEGGVIQAVENVPDGVRVVVMDFDVEG